MAVLTNWPRAWSSVILDGEPCRDRPARDDADHATTRIDAPQKLRIEFEEKRCHAAQVVVRRDRRRARIDRTVARGHDFPHAREPQALQRPIATDEVGD